MGEKPFLDDYTGQSTGELIALGEEYRVDSVVLAFESAIEKKLQRMGPDALSEAELDVLAVEAMEREVNNGGYCQLFSNESRYFVRILPQALAKIACPKTRAITDQAIRIVGTTDPEQLLEIMSSDDETSEDLLDSLSERCDEPYYETGEDIAARLFEYIVRNRDAINLP